MSKVKIHRDKKGGLLFKDVDGTKVKMSNGTTAEVTPEFLETQNGKFLLLRGDIKPVVETSSTPLVSPKKEEQVKEAVVETQESETSPQVQEQEVETKGSSDEELTSKDEKKSSKRIKNNV